LLSIGKLKAGQAKYYLDQAEGRVDVIDSVADGMEDYYLGAPEARGEWIGSAGLELGLSGPVEADDLRRVLAGLDPRDGSPLRGASSRVRVAGFDLTFSAPKSVSVLFGLGDESLRRRTRAAHDVAVREALGYLERSAAAVRRGHGGVVVEEASGLVAAGFRHRTSRAGDPQLHTHVLVANLGRASDGRWSALDGRRLYAHARTGSFVYQAVLRSELTRRLGVEWTPVRDGIGEVVGVPLTVRKAFSRRRADIEAALDDHGRSSPRAAEAAALATRRAKDRTVDAESLVAERRSRAQALGFGIDELQAVLDHGRTRGRREAETDKIWRLLAGPLGLTRRRATFSRRDVIQALSEWLPPEMAGLSRGLESAADAFLRSDYVVTLIPSDEVVGESFRRRDGRLMPASGELVTYSTREHMALEQRFVGRVIASAGTGAGSVPERAVGEVIGARPTLTAEQRTLVERACLSGDGVTVIAGVAGSGKTYALSAAREAWQAAGYPVLGVAIARRATSELRDGAGIQSTTVAALLQDLRRSGRGLPARTVLVVDEAGMVPTRELAVLLDGVESASGKLVLVGDHRQLPELEAGGVFRGLVHRGLAVELRGNVRQKHVWEREALEQLRHGRGEEAIAQYDARGRITVEADEAATRAALVRDWLAAAGDSVMLAHRRVDVAELNRLAREKLRADGRLGADELQLAGGTFAVGDRVVVKRNELALEIHNGDRGIVTAVDPGRGAMKVELAGRPVELDAPFLTGATRDGGPTLLHGYAITGHIAQGLTVDRAFVLADHGVSPEWAYVALSRGRESNQLYVSEHQDDLRSEFAPADPEPPNPIARLAASLRSSSAQVLAIDSGQPSEERILELQRRAMAAARERQGRESSRFSWLPGARHARREEERAREELAQARRRMAEDEHGKRPFVTNRELQADDQRIAREALGRPAQRQRTRDSGRSL
jgi:conjugative relaxase-like TrwC/TraI family protein